MYIWHCKITSMKNIHDTATLQEFIQRIEQLKPGAEHQWGKMSVSQMMAHCSNALEVNLGDRESKQSFIGKIFGKLAKKSVVSDKPFKQNLPTAPGFVVTDTRDFNAEKQRLLSLLKRLSAKDPASLSKVHPFFGTMTPEEWNMLNYKHLDHHLRQFSA